MLHQGAAAVCELVQEGPSGMALSHNRFLCPPPSQAVTASEKSKGSGFGLRFRIADLSIAQAQAAGG